MARAAGWAAAGAGLLALFYFVTNAIPVLRSLDSLPVSALTQPLLLLLLPQLVWTWFFLVLWRKRPGRRAALITLVAAVAPQAIYSWARQWPTLSPFSIDSILYLFSGIIQPLAYAWFLISVFRISNPRRVSYVLWILTTVRAMSTAVSTAVALFGIRGSLATFWSEEPARMLWNILAAPAILIYYWGSQSFFFQAVRKHCGKPDG